MLEKRAIHGQYDASKKLPDNNLKPTGSGTDVWFLRQILDIDDINGQRLIEQAKEHGTQRYKWLAGYMREVGYIQLVEEYELRKKQDTAIWRYRDCERRIKNRKARLVEEASYGEKHLNSLKIQIAKGQKYLDERKEIAELIEQRKAERNNS